MKNASTFKTLVDFLYIAHIIGLVLTLFLIPFGKMATSEGSIAVANFGTVEWVQLALGTIGYIILIRGLYYLRKVARHLMGSNHFEDTIILNLKKSGQHFVIVGLLYLLSLVSVWFVNLLGGHIDLVLSSNALMAIFLLLIGLFFIIQSATLYQAKEIKEENELMV